MAGFTGNLREIRKIYDMRDVLGADGGKDKIVCPLPQHSHGNYSPSFHIFVGGDGVQRFQCFGTCGLRGDVIDLIGFLRVSGYDPHDTDKVKEAAELLTDFEPMTEPLQRPEKPGLPPNAWRSYLPLGPEVIDYAATRGLAEDTLKKFKVGQHRSHWMAIPVFEESELRMVKFRNTWPIETLDENKGFDYLRFWAQEGSTKGLFNYNSVAYTTEPVLFLKGEIPVMLLDQLGFKACTVTGGESAFIERYTDVLSFADKIVVVGDNDPKPEVRTKMVAKAQYRADLLRAELCFPPEPYKDIDEWVLKDPAAIGVINEWLY